MSIVVSKVSLNVYFHPSPSRRHFGFKEWREKAELFIKFACMCIYKAREERSRRRVAISSKIMFEMLMKNK